MRQTTNYKLQLQTTNYKLQTTNYKLQTTNYKLQITNYKLQTTNYKLLDIVSRIPLIESFNLNHNILIKDNITYNDFGASLDEYCNVYFKSRV